MAKKGGEVKLRLDHIRLRVAEGVHQSTKAVALDIEGRAKVNIQQNDQIDTGFMLNSGYSGWEGGSNHGSIWGSGRYRSPKTGSTALHEAAGPAIVEKGAFVHFAALYAIWQELKNSFLYRAAEETEPKPIVEKIFQAVLRD